MSGSKPFFPFDTPLKLEEDNWLIGLHKLEAYNYIYKKNRKSTFYNLTNFIGLLL